MRTHRLAVRFCWLLLGSWMLVCVLDTGWIKAEQLASKEALQKPFDATRERRTELLNGTAENKATAADKPVANAAANYYILRITVKALKYAAVQDEFASQVQSVDGKKADRVFLNMFGEELVKRMKDVLAPLPARKPDEGQDKDKVEQPEWPFAQDPTTVINACMMLPTMAKLKQDNINKFLADLVKDEKTHEVVRLYAFKALKETMPVRVQPDEEDILEKGAKMTRKDLEIKIVKELAKHIENKVEVKGMVPEQVAVVQYMRREAIMALAQAGAPAVTAYKKQLEGEVAPTLLRVLANDIEPPAKMQEKIEAAVGLCAMKYDKMPEYNHEVATYLIGRMLGEYVDEYKLDWANFADKTAKRKLPKVAWKTESRRLELALKDLAANARSAKAKEIMVGTLSATKADHLERIAAPTLKIMKDYGTPDERVTNLNQFVNQIMPKSGRVFTSFEKEVPLK
jgi:hypothetical protein